VDYVELADLWIAYFLGLLVFLCIFIFFQPHQIISKEAFALLGLALMYIGRIITKMEGSFYGRLHYTALLVSPITYIILKSVSINGAGFDTLGREIGIQSIFNIIINFVSLVIAYFDVIVDSSDGTPMIIIAFIGSICIATVGEWYLSNLSPTIRSHLCVSDKFPSRFISMPTIKAEKKKEEFIKKQMFGKPRSNNGDLISIDSCGQYVNSDEIIKIKCVSTSLGIIHYAKDSINEQFIKSIKSEISKFDYRIVIAPEKNALDNFKRALDDLPYGISNILKLKSEFISEYKEEYIRNYTSLADLAGEKKVMIHEYYFCGVPFLITENKSGYKRLLFLVKDRGTVGNRVGLYTDDQYFIEALEDVFENIWYISQDHKIKSIINESALFGDD